MADVSGNNANISGSPYPIDSDKYTTLVGEFQNSASAYGTFDQGGNVWEWNNSVISYYGSTRGGRGGSFTSNSNNLASSFRDNGAAPWNEGYDLGFRVANVPEPSTLILLAAGAIGFFGWAWRRRKRIA